ncbi:DUF3772 domain-containing protein [Cognatishimia sp. SS12]|uniref:DUF3772 domain-containing protein n=1 Tax=Cognatishimia sp. SS12 TaxID=2979465 RepID=UPI00233051AC|nr:DUF3772 domain-containing protein [Cognatishimia sp. SS12]MDC0737223.1 DUF3772 domain-containing protein [Cognatishimia sp. SS12]
MPRIANLIFATVLLFCSAVFSVAQTAAGPDYSEWNSLAARAADAVEAGRASDVALEDLRGQIDAWRERFRAAQSINSNAIETVQTQLNTLGPVPESGEEPADIKAQRAALNTQLAELQVPSKRAEVALAEAEGLIRGIDTILRARQTDELLELGPTPLNPVLWPSALDTLLTSIGHVTNEMGVAWQNPIQKTELRHNFPEVLLLLAVAFLLLSRGRGWFEALANTVQTRGAFSGRWLAASVVSLGQIILPFVGLLALIEAAYATELPGLRGELLLSTLPEAGLLVLVSIWLGSRVFPQTSEVLPFIRLEDGERREGRLYAGILGSILAVNGILTEIAQYDGWSDGTRAVLFFPLFAVAAVIFWRLAVLLGHHERPDSTSATYGDRVLSIIKRLIMAAALIGLALACIGYFRAAQQLIMPAIMTMQVLAFVLILQRITSAIFSLVMGEGDDLSDGLVPVLLGVMLILAALPFLALIWGARWSDLTELWTDFSNGFAIGETRISLADFFTFVLVFVVGFTITRLLQGAMKNTILPKTKMDLGGRNAIVSGLGYVGIFLAALIAITAAGIDLSSIALVAGALSVGIGFGLQNVVSNFVSGIILLIERPISEGDWIEVNGNMGYVRDISVRSTRIETFDRTDVIVPNADLVSGTVTNFTRGNTIGRAIVPVGVAYGTDPRRVEKILMEIVRAHPLVLENPPPAVLFTGFGASSLDFEIRAILRDVNWQMAVKSELNFEVARRFEEEKIEIPFPQSDIWLRNPETLRPQTQATPPAQDAETHPDEDSKE